MRNFIALLIISFVSIVHGESLSLEDYLQSLRESDPEIRKLNLRSEQYALLVDERRDDDAFQLNLETYKGFGNDNFDSESLSASVEKPISETGTVVSLTHSRGENPDQDVKVSELEVEQSLVKNAFGKDKRKEIENLEAQSRMSFLQALEDYENYMAVKMKLFLEVSKAQTEFDFLQSIKNDAKSLHDFIAEKAQKGAANTSDLKRARLQLIEREQALMSARDELKVLKQDLFENLAFPRELEVESQVNLKSEFSFSELSFSKDNFRLVEQARLQQSIASREYQLRSHDDDLDLKVFGAYTMDESTRFTNTVDRSETTVGLRLSMPLGSNKIRAGKGVAVLQEKIAVTELKALEKSLQKAFAQQELILTKLQAEFDLAQEKIVLIEDVLEDDKKRYSRGLINLDRVLDTSNDYYNYQFELNNSKLALNKAYVDWLALNDLLIKSRDDYQLF